MLLRNGKSLSSRRRPLPGKNNSQTSKTVKLSFADADQQRMWRALLDDVDFDALWHYVLDIKKLNVSFIPGYQIDGRERFGGFQVDESIEGERAELIINPTKEEHKLFPRELGDTIIHECLHAALYFRELDEHDPEKRDQCPLDVRIIKDRQSDTYLDSFSGSHQRGLLKKKHFVLGHQRRYMEKEYGDSLCSPLDEYTDLNKGGQAFIDRILARVGPLTGLWSATLPARRCLHPHQHAGPDGGSRP